MQLPFHDLFEVDPDSHRSVELQQKENLQLKEDVEEEKEMMELM
jgi:hypothetical protein